MRPRTPTWTETILSEIRHGWPAADVAATYAAAREAERIGAERPDWARIHAAAAGVWKAAGLSALRQRAQLIVDGLIVPRRRPQRGFVDFRTGL